jgi:PAS domain S-box-containing protein
VTVDRFIQQLEVLYNRISASYGDAGFSTSIQPEFLPIALKELGTASEELQVIVETLRQQNEELMANRATVEAERRYYQDLFEFAPDAYLVTDLQGMIRQANRVAVKHFNCPRGILVGKPLTVFVSEAERQNFRTYLNSLRQLQRAQEIEWRLQRTTGEFFDAALTVVPLTDNPEAPGSLVGWSIRDMTNQKQIQAAPLSSEYDPRQDFPAHTFTKGELIPLQFQSICWVCQGIVKLSTLSDTGKEILTGLAGAAAPFGPTLTALPIYQAIALSTVQIVYIPLAQMASSPSLAQLVFDKVSQRLKQTELLLAIAGEQRVKDRLCRLLQLLKQEVGEAVPNGTRLMIRFTHEELASACSTTRVTVTRLLNQLSQDGQISLDAKHHIVLHEEQSHRSTSLR